MAEGTQGKTRLTDFLLARIAEDEAAELDALRTREPVLPFTSRRLPGIPADLPPIPDTPDGQAAIAGTLTGQMIALRAAWRRLGVQFFVPSPNALRMLAARYADHPDYREEWRP